MPTEKRRRTEVNLTARPQRDVVHDWEKDDEELELEAALFGTSKKRAKGVNDHARVSGPEDEEVDGLDDLDDEEVGVSFPAEYPSCHKRHADVRSSSSQSMLPSLMARAATTTRPNTGRKAAWKMLLETNQMPQGVTQYLEYPKTRPKVTTANLLPPWLSMIPAIRFHLVNSATR